MDFGALPPEINSARMYAGPGSGSMLAAATAWNGLAAELQSTASSYGSVITELTDESWVGPSSTSMAAAAAPYVAWMTAAAGQAEQTAGQARAAASAYQVALTAMVPLPEIAANRTQLAALTATNILGQNTPAIATTEAQYGEMWAQDAATMYGYAGSSAAASTLTAFTAPPSTTSLAGSAAQGAAVAQATGTSTGTGVQSTLSQLISTIQTSLQGLASPSSSTSSTSGLSGLLSPLLGGSSTGSSTTRDPRRAYVLVVRVLASSSFLQSVAIEYADIPGFFGMFMAANALAPLVSWDAENVALSQAMTPRRGRSAGGGGVAAPMAAGGAAGRRRRAGVRVRWRFGRMWRAWGKQPQSARCRFRRAGAGPRHPRRRCWVACRWRRRCRASIRARQVGYQWQPVYR